MTTQQEYANNRIEGIRHLATHIYENFCDDEETKAEWDLELWVNLDSQSPTKAEFYDKAEKIYNYLGGYQEAKKFIELIETCPKAARTFFNFI